MKPAHLTTIVVQSAPGVDAEYPFWEIIVRRIHWRGCRHIPRRQIPAFDPILFSHDVRNEVVWC